MQQLQRRFNNLWWRPPLQWRLPLQCPPTSPQRNIGKSPPNDWRWERDVASYEGSILEVLCSLKRLAMLIEMCLANGSVIVLEYL